MHYNYYPDAVFTSLVEPEYGRCQDNDQPSHTGQINQLRIPMDPIIAIYFGASVITLVITYKLKWLARVDWSNPKLYERQESTSSIVVIDPRAPQAGLAGIAAASRPSTIAGDIGLFLMFVWLIGFATGGILAPAFFGKFGEITTANVAMIFGAALAWGFIFARIYVTAMLVFIGFILPLLLLVAIIGFIAAFAMGGTDKLMSSIGWNSAAKHSLNAQLSDRAAKKRMALQANKNMCTMFSSLSFVGDIERVRRKCDKE